MKDKSHANGAGLLLSDRIRSSRRRAKLSQAALASVVGVTPGAVAQLESVSGTKPGIDRLEKIALATKVPFDWLATGLGQRRGRAEVTAPALTLESFAYSCDEEIVLERFRRLPPKARGLLRELLENLTSPRR